VCADYTSELASIAGMAVSAEGNALAVMTFYQPSDATYRMRVITSSDGGDTWDNLSILEPTDTTYQSGDMIALANGDILVSAATTTATRVYRSTDSGRNFVVAQTLTATSQRNVKVAYTQFAQTANGDVYLASRLKLYKSTDNGASWTNIYTSPGTNYLVALIASGNRLIVIGTRGYTYTDNGGSSFATSVAWIIGGFSAQIGMHRWLALSADTYLESINGQAAIVTTANANFSQSVYTEVSRGWNNFQYRPAGTTDIFLVDWSSGGITYVSKFANDFSSYALAGTPSTNGGFAVPFSAITITNAPPPGKFWTRLGGTTQTFS
jgi:hypothetical protein